MSNEISIPKYTLAEELINSISHGVGVLFGIFALVITVTFAALHHNTVGIVASCIYGISMIIMYLFSCLYHAFSPNLLAKKVFRVIDHCDIYAYIAGCYTPFCISLLGGKIGWGLFIVIWICAITGIIINIINLEKFKKLSLALYLIMGWMVIISFRPLMQVLPVAGLWLLAGGGIVYSLGAILYVIGGKKKYLHSIFHFFVLGGTILQFFSILLYTI